MNQISREILNLMLLICYLSAFLAAYSCKKDKPNTPNLPIDNSNNCSENNFISDQDGNTYPVVKIGQQCWMGKNLQTSKFQDGSNIPIIESNSQWASAGTGACCNHSNSDSIGNIYGKLYNWYVVADPRNVCPAGWHVPNEEDWNKLIDYLGGSNEAGGKLKSLELWNSPNAGATNSANFNALPASHRIYSSGNFGLLGFLTTYWSAESTSNTTAWTRGIGFSSPNISRNEHEKKWGYSIRCVKD